MIIIIEYVVILLGVQSDKTNKKVDCLMFMNQKEIIFHTAMFCFTQFKMKMTALKILMAYLLMSEIDIQNGCVYIRDFKHLTILEKLNGH